MPAHASNGSAPSDATAVSVACPRPSTASLQSDGGSEPDRDVSVMSPPASDNTAMGMSMRQEESMYSSPEQSQEAGQQDAEKEKVDLGTTRQEGDTIHTKQSDSDILPTDDALHAPDTPTSIQDSGTQRRMVSKLLPSQSPMNTQLQTPSPTLSNASIASTVHARGFVEASGIPSIDKELKHTSEPAPWEFSKRLPRTQYPSSLLQTGSRYIGTQQSDRQIYNVEVTILTVDMDQCMTSGYLQICGLTPDHPTLTTFFTGEIIGGPDQKFSFRTKNPEWGATDKTDMTHWARFPAWRSLSSQAKQNLSFVHPSDHSPWWQQESIFMRWKENFLVPDYKLRSIQGASFEGFYYICLNQIEGKISGIYFHSKSEK
jgi:Vacuolar import and degradation protein